MTQSLRVMPLSQESTLIKLMFSITSIDKIDYFTKEPKIISIFLATRLDMTAVKWVFDGWLDLHITTGHNWHLLVPTYDPIDDKLSKANSSNFNSDLSRELIKQYGLDLKSTPCLVFDDLNEEAHQHYISFQDHKEGEIKNFFLDCAKLIERNDPYEHEIPPGLWRSKVIGEIYNRSQAKKYGKSVLKATPIIGQILKLGFTK